jgi:hypothetical protein
VEVKKKTTLNARLQFYVVVRTGVWNS